MSRIQNGVIKQLEGIRKETRRGGQSLEIKRAKEEEAVVEKVLALLESHKDVRKGEWTNKEVGYFTIFCCYDERSSKEISKSNSSSSYAKFGQLPSKDF